MSPSSAGDELTRKALAVFAAMPCEPASAAALEAAFSRPRASSLMWGAEDADALFAKSEGARAKFAKLAATSRRAIALDTSVVDDETALIVSCFARAHGADAQGRRRPLAPMLVGAAWGDTPILLEKWRRLDPSIGPQHQTTTLSVVNPRVNQKGTVLIEPTCVLLVPPANDEHFAEVLAALGSAVVPVRALIVGNLSARPHIFRDLLVEQERALAAAERDELTQATAETERKGDDNALASAQTERRSPRL
jgi:hypothetical protein